MKRFIQNTLAQIGYCFLRAGGGEIVAPLEPGKFFSQAGRVYIVESVVLDNQSRIKITGRDSYIWERSVREYNE